MSRSRQTPSTVTKKVIALPKGGKIPKGKEEKVIPNCDKEIAIIGKLRDNILTKDLKAKKSKGKNGTGMKTVFIPKVVSANFVKQTNDNGIVTITYSQKNKSKVDELIKEVNFGKVQPIRTNDNDVLSCCIINQKICSEYSMFKNAEDEWISSSFVPVNEINEIIRTIVEKYEDIVYVLVGEQKYISAKAPLYSAALESAITEKKFVPCHVIDTKKMQFAFVGFLKPVYKQTLTVPFITGREIDIDVFYFAKNDVKIDEGELNEDGQEDNEGKMNEDAEEDNEDVEDQEVKIDEGELNEEDNDEPEYANANMTEETEDNEEANASNADEDENADEQEDAEDDNDEEAEADEDENAEE